MRIAKLSMFLAALMILSVLPLGQIQVNSTPDSSEKIQTQTSDLSDDTVTSLAEGRQSGPATAHWDFDTTSFSMMATSTTNAGIDGIEYHPCEAAWGWRDDQQNQVFNLSIGIGFSLIGCLILLLMFFDFILTSMIVSIIGFYLFYIFEKSTWIFNEKDEDYKKFRKILTLLVCISFLISIGYWINPYSSPYL